MNPDYVYVGYQMRCIVLFAKAPIPGEVKTRLQPHLSSDDAASLHEAFVLDTLDALREIDGVDICLACHPDMEQDFFVDIKRDFGVDLISQGEGDLGERMMRALTVLSSKGYKRIVILGSDSPTLPGELVKDAFASLGKSSLVIGPGLDGGYYLLGLSGDVPDIFDGVSWGSGTVFEETMKRVKKSGTSFSILPFWYDVDTINELRFLAIHLSALPLSRCRQTRNILKRIEEKILIQEKYEAPVTGGQQEI